ncbi:hypothetical protein BH11MYX4_BH11MYX4_02040 [soil metagenome]
MKSSTALLSRVSAGAVLTLLLVQGRAGAQQAAPAKNAETLFREGRQLMDAKDFAAACPRFAESQKLEPAPGTLLNLADCYEKSGQTASAWTTFKEAAKAATARSRADWASTATQRAAALEPKLATIAVTVGPASDVPGLHLERDGVGVERGAWGTAVPVDPGAHVLGATATGKKPWTRRIEVAPTKNVLVDVPVLEPEAPSAPAPPVGKKPEAEEPAPRETGGSGMRVAGYVVTGLGVVGLAVGTVTGLQALGRRSDAENKCVSYPSRCSPEASAANDDAQKLATVSTATLIAGGVLVVGGVILILVAPRHADTRATLPGLLSGTF